jgi:hypothetical protein
MTLEEYNLNYEMYLAEIEMNDDMFSFAGLFNESVGLYIVQEGVKETVMKYITRIVEAITNAWKKFMEVMDNKKDQAYLKFIKTRLDGAKGTTDHEFVIPDANIQDPLKAIENLNVVPLDNYQEMQNYLDTVDGFLDHYYQNFKDGDKPIDESIRSKVFVDKHDKHIDQNVIKQMYTYCTDNYTDIYNSLKKDLNNFNQSSRNIENLVSQVVNANIPAQGTQESVTLESFFVFNEAPETPNPSNNPDGGSNDKKGERFSDDKTPGQEGQKNESVQKHIVNYCKASTKIITTKMNIAREVKKNYIRIFRHCIKGEPGTETEEGNQDTTQRQQAPQVEV